MNPNNNLTIVLVDLNIRTGQARTKNQRCMIQFITQYQTTLQRRRRTSTDTFPFVSIELSLFQPAMVYSVHWWRIPCRMPKQLRCPDIPREEIPVYHAGVEYLETIAEPTRSRLWWTYRIPVWYCSWLHPGFWWYEWHSRRWDPCYSQSQGNCMNPGWWLWLLHQ